MKELNLDINQLKAELREIKMQMINGKLSYEEAKKTAQPVVDGINWLVMDICFKYDRTIKTYSFGELIKHLQL